MRDEHYLQGKIEDLEAEVKRLQADLKTERYIREQHELTIREVIEPTHVIPVEF